MQTSRLALCRIPPLRRPLRPPSSFLQHPKPRPFTHNSQLLLVISPSVGPRPQLPFLHPASAANASLRRHPPPFGQRQLARLLTTESKKYIKEQVWIAGKWTLFLWTSVGLLFIAAFGVQNEILERRTPTPPEWSTISRMNYRSARAQEDPEFWPSGLTDWASAGSMYKGLLERLEDPNIDGAGLQEQEEGGILVPGVGMAGFDGYHEVLMGCARAAEHLDGWVKDTTRRICFPPDVVIGPSNPNPRPCPPYAHEAPLEENCVPAFEQPETYYMKVLTTKGFSTGQRLDAALAYAEWLDFKGLPDSAAEMYTWALDIAASGIPDAATVIDTTTGIIRDSSAAVAPSASPNIARAATALATHHARQRDVTKALPIFLSVLRARTTAPVSTSSTLSTPPPPPPPPPPPSSTPNDTGVLSTIRSVLAPPSYPSPPPTGDDPLTRTPASVCDEAALKTYIGEILFATSPSSRDTGLGWTRDAVADAEAGVGESSALVPAEKERCAQCLEVALGNLAKMIGVLAEEEREGRTKAKESWGGEEEEEEGVWEREEREVLGRIEALRKEGLRARFARAGKVKGGTWIG
ncbi:hypothetical protein B0J12DRAFT_774908 [Macrophomina phaseolina]|uniref:MFS maltose permease n=1 Tax=Macrophomina phaseolina TaxID=35725 RepID=A0ABQ8GIT4_9PEZI|nr:hypothetical protein B0J12DRAFT_774908 [Macrophomina phaseolina]